MYGPYYRATKLYLRSLDPERLQASRVVGERPSGERTSDAESSKPGLPEMGRPQKNHDPSFRRTAKKAPKFWKHPSADVEDGCFERPLKGITSSTFSELLCKRSRRRSDSLDQLTH